MGAYDATKAAGAPRLVSRPVYYRLTYISGM
jgi:hypothetical protein